MAAPSEQETGDKLSAYHAVTLGQNTDSETLIKMYDDVSPEYEYVSTTPRIHAQIHPHTHTYPGPGSDRGWGDVFQRVRTERAI